MSIGTVRAIAFGAMAGLGVSVVVLTEPLPRQAEAQTTVGVAVEPEPESRSGWRVRYDTVEYGETVALVLARAGMPESVARTALNSSKRLDQRRIRAGMPVTTRSRLQDTIPTEISLGVGIDSVVHLRMTPNGWTEEIEKLPWTVDTVVVSGVIQSNLYNAMHDAARDQLVADMRERLAVALADLYEFRVDMSRDLRVGDEFTVIAERESGVQGDRLGRVLTASMTLSGQTTEAIPFRSARVSGEYFDAAGRSLRSGFLRAPLAFRRISSVFGMRRHPILGTMRKHQGTDYAANAGTPIRTVGDGVIIRAGWHSGYGNVVDVRHPNGYVTRYGHMRGFARGVSAGKRVTVGNTIGYVGSTGLSTAPHLHFEVLVNGVQRDSRVALRNSSSPPIPAAERVTFAAARERAQEMLRTQLALASAGAEAPSAGKDTPQP